jgi:hypothetical protein
MSTPCYYDYENQCWIVDDKVDTCGHPETMDCQCYSRLHAGEPASVNAAEAYAAEGY